MDAGSESATRLRRFRRLTCGVILALTVFGLTDVRRRARIDPADPDAHRTDLTIVTGAGAAFLADETPYEYANPRGWRYCYPPLYALALSPLASLEPKLQAVVWYGLSCLMGWLAWREAMRVGRGLGFDFRLTPANRTSGRIIGWAAAVAIALPALNCLQRGQVGLLTLWLLMWGYRLLAEAVTWRAALLGGVVLALPGVIKVTPALPAVIAVGAWGAARWKANGVRWRRPLAWAGAGGLTAGAAIGLLILPAAILGWGPNLRHLETWAGSIATMAVEVDPSSELETPYTVRNQNLANAVYRCGNWIDHAFFGGDDDRTIDAVPFNPDHELRMDAAWVRPTILTIRLALLILLVVGAWRAGSSGGPAAAAAAFGLAAVASLVVSPISRGHYFVLLLPAALFVPAWIRRIDHHPTPAMTWTLPVLSLLHYAALDMTGRIGLLGLGTTAWFVVGAVRLLRSAAAEPASNMAEDGAEQVGRPHSRAA